MYYREKKGDYIGQLAEYVKKNLTKGYTKDSLRFALIKQGHSRMEVEKALKRAETDLAGQAPLLKTTPSITYEAQPITETTSLPEERPFWKRWFGL